MAEEERKKWFTAEELAEDLQVSKQTIYKWGKEGRLDRLKIGTVTRFRLPIKEESWKR